MEAVLRHAYTEQLCDVGGDVNAVSSDMLLSVMVAADRLFMARCFTDCCVELERRGQGDGYDHATVIAIFALPPSLFEHMEFQADVKAATVRLLQLLGDAEAVYGAQFEESGRLHHEFQRLNLASLVTLLRSDALKARSENNVLMMADLWVGGPIGARCSEAQLDEVTRCVRLCQLSHTFLFDVLPQLAWLRLGSEDQAALMRFAAAATSGEVGAGGISLRQQDILKRRRITNGTAWFNVSKRALYDGELEFEYSFTREQLQQAVTQRQQTWLIDQASDSRLLLEGPRAFFFNGFVVRPCMTFSCGAAGNCGISQFVDIVSAVGGRLRFESVHFSEVHHISLAAVSWSNPVQRQGLQSHRLHQCFTLVVNVKALKVFDVAAWSRFLRDDSLQIRCKVLKME